MSTYGSMSVHTGQAHLWDLPNYSGELFTADLVNTPILNMLGGLTNGGLQTENFEFPVASEYEFPSAEQPEDSEADSLTAPTATAAERQQLVNVTQIFHRAVKLSYEKLASRGRLSGVNTAGQQNNLDDELAWQIDYNLRIIARNVEYTIINGEYNKASNENEANKTRGLLAACDLSGGTAIDASGDELDKDTMQQLFRDMFSAGAMLMNPVILVNGYQKQKISDIYGYAPESREVGGLNIQQIETDFGPIGVLNAHRFMDNDKLAVVDMEVVNPVFQPVPGKGNFFYEDLSKTGASEDGQLFGKFGLDHGPAFAHGKITNLATS